MCRVLILSYHQEYQEGQEYLLNGVLVEIECLNVVFAIETLQVTHFWNHQDQNNSLMACIGNMMTRAVTHGLMTQGLMTDSLMDIWTK